MKKIYIVFAAFVAAVLAMICSPTLSAHADMGPKPSLELHIEEPPECLYYVDILTDHNIGTPPDDEKYNAEMLDILKNFEYDGMRARFSGLGGIDAAMHPSNESHTHFFTYDIPSEFYILIVTEDLRTIVSPKVSPYGYNAVLTFNAASGKVSENHVGSAVRLLIAFVMTCTATILIERIIFLFFGMHLHRNRYTGIFVRTNIATQAFLYVCIVAAKLTGFPLDAGLPLYLERLIEVAPEVLIAITESAIFSRKLTNSPQDKIVSCTVTANLISALLGAPLFMVLSFLRLF